MAPLTMNITNMLTLIMNISAFAISLIGTGVAIAASEQKIRDIVTVWVLTYSLFLIAYMILQYFKLVN